MQLLPFGPSATSNPAAAGLLGMGTAMPANGFAMALDTALTAPGANAPALPGTAAATANVDPAAAGLVKTPPTPLAQLLATAARLPQPDAAAPAPEVAGEAAATPLPANGVPAAAKPELNASAKPVPVKAGSDDAASIEADAALLPDAATAAPRKPEAAAPEPVGPRKPVRAKDAANDQAPEIIVAKDALAPAPVATPVAAPVQQPVAQPQQTAGQRTTKGEAAPVAIKGARVAQSDAAAANADQDAPGTDRVASKGTNAFAAALDASADKGSEQHSGGEQRGDAMFRADATPASQFGANRATATTSATAAAPAQPAHEPVVDAHNQLGKSMGVEIARKIGAGEETLRVSLNPAELGRVEVTLAFDDGNLRATMRTESAAALDLLRQDTPDLQRTLDQAGIRSDAQSFRFESRADTGSGQAGSQHQQQQNRGTMTASDETEIQAEYRAVRADGQLDLLA